MSFDTSTIIAGPATIQRGNQYFLTEGNVKLSLNKETKEKKTGLYGTVAQKFLSVKAEISFKPAGLYAAFFAPFASLAYGERLYGNTSVPTVVWSVDGKKYTFARTAITSIPNLSLGVEKDIIGDVTISAIMDTSKDWSDADAVFTITEAAFTPQAVDMGIFRDGPFSVLYDGAAVETEEGVEISFNLNTTDVKVDRVGVVDAVFSGLDITASFKPLSWSEATVKTKAGIAGTRGGLITGLPLTVSDPVGDIITIRSVVPTQSGFNFGAAVTRQDTIEFKSTRYMQAGIPGPWFLLGFSDAEQSQ